ncbi:hypothetical protein EST38_g7277 [Candolleomyces aberdarensis]|uniref:Importin N-terminal domain-containing protein n=1 Tax=Candolleomyces aberdarensis TaxID=2316362 RepID=A0A4V1Q3H2_9AGAR|nr:hypothetical protein EST38_g7277 [Candolleomyces aberdarensis]
MASPAEIAQILTATLSPDTNTRVAAELKLAEIFVQPLSFIARVIAPGILTLRPIYSASITLRKYIRERWSPIFPTFKGSAPAPEVKSKIRDNLFLGLSDPNRKIRSLSAHALSSVANADWPDEYPELLQNLITLVSSASPNSVHGAMQVFTEFIKSDLTEDQILPVLRELLPVLLSILGSNEHAAPTRARTISVFRQCVSALYMVKDQYPDAVNEATTGILPVWLEAFKTLLNIDLQPELNGAETWDGLLVRTQIFKTLDVIRVSFPASLTAYLPDLLASSLHHLQAVYPAFTHYYLLASDPVPQTSEDETVDLPQLICPILDFLSSVSRSGKARTWFIGGNLSALIAAVFNLVQMTDEDEDNWANNPNAFIAQEDDETQQYSVRVAGFDLLSALIDRVQLEVTKNFQSALQHTINASQQAREGGNSEWWKPLEAALAAVGSQAQSILDCLEDQEAGGLEKPIDIDYFLLNVIPSILTLPEHPFLQGRGFVFASQFSKLLQAQSANQYLEAAVQVIESTEAGAPVKISAVKAVQNFYEGGDEDVLAPFAPRIARDLGPFLGLTSEDTLTLVLETLSVVLGVNFGQWLTPELASALAIACLEVWHKNNKDPIFISLLADILKELASSSSAGIYETVVKQALPILVEAIGSAKATESWIPSAAIEFAQSLAAGAPAEKGLGDGFFALLAPSLFQCLDQTEDRDVLQTGITCLTLVVRKECNQLVSWTGADGRGGLDHVLGLVAKLLQSQEEAGGLAIGDLIIHLFRRTGEAVLPVLPQLLEAMLKAMTTAKTASYTQSLVIPFAFLINNQRDTVLDLIEHININGRSGFDILLNTWCENAETFQGYWPSRLSTLGLTQLLLSERQSIRSLIVKGDMILKAETKNAPHEFSSIPFPVKALKIIVHDLQSGGDAATISAQGGFKSVETLSEDGEDDWDEEEGLVQGFKPDEFAFLSEMLGPKGVAFDNDDYLDDNDDEDLKNDPISQMDMQSHLRTFIRDYAAQHGDAFGSIAGQLNVEESLVVHQVLNA